MWRRQWSWKSDRYDAYGVAVALVVVVAVGVATGDLRGWLVGVSLGCGLANITSFVLRRITPGGRAELRRRMEVADQKRHDRRVSFPADTQG